MRQQHNGYWISGSAVPGPPYTTYWNPSGDVLFQRANSSVVELVRFTLDSSSLPTTALLPGSGWKLRGSWWMSVWDRD